MRTAPWMVGHRERERERARDEKARTVYGVFKHSSGDGYVVRTGREEDGKRSFPSPYNAADPVAISKSEKLAQRRADKLNGR